MQARPKIKVLYQDAHLLAAHKPPGIATYQESRNQNAPGLKELLEEQLTQRLFPVHRIDADTSGVVLFALDSRSASHLISAFKSQKIQKTYTAWCEGVPNQKTGSIKAPLQKNKSDLKESARTDYQVLLSKNGKSLLKISPFTGRFHQIRRHLASIGHPIVGDPLYGKGGDRLMLQAESIQFKHPAREQILNIKTKEKL